MVKIYKYTLKDSRGNPTTTSFAFEADALSLRTLHGNAISFSAVNVPENSSEYKLAQQNSTQKSVSKKASGCGCG